MSVMRLNLAAVIVLSLLCTATATPGWAAQHKKARKAAAKQEVAPAPAPEPAPPTPLTLAQMPATAPQVSFKNGQLMIVAQNSTLSDILRAVHQQTGASFEVPPSATERVVTHLGPGPAREVLASLLNGSHFDYVMVGSNANPMALDHVILMAKGAEQPASAGGAGQPQGLPQAAPPPAENAEATVDDFSDENTDDLTAEQPQPDDQQTAEQQQQQQQNGQPGVKTPEQLLLELQQRQQAQQQQGAPTPAAPQGFPIPPGQQPPPQQPPQPQPPQ